MIRRTGPTTVYIDKPTWRIKICQRDPSGCQSVQVFPDLTKLGQFESYTYLPHGFEVEPLKADNCQTIDDLRNLLKKHSRKVATAV